MANGIHPCPSLFINTERIPAFCHPSAVFLTFYDTSPKPDDYFTAALARRTEETAAAGVVAEDSDGDVVAVEVVAPEVVAAAVATDNEDAADALATDAPAEPDVVEE